MTPRFRFSRVNLPKTASYCQRIAKLAKFLFKLKMHSNKPTCAEACYASRLSRFIEGYCVDPLMCSIPVSSLFIWLSKRYASLGDTLPYMDMMPKSFTEVYGELTTGDMLQAFTLLIVQFLYFFLYETISGGRTLGKRMCSTVVVDINGNRPPVWRILIRTLCRFIPFDNISFLFSGWAGGTLRGAWHDRISGTYVVETRLLELWKQGRYDGSDRFAAAIEAIMKAQEELRKEADGEDVDEQDGGGEHKLRVEDLYPQDDADNNAAEYKLRVEDLYPQDDDEQPGEDGKA